MVNVGPTLAEAGPNLTDSGQDVVEPHLAGQIGPNAGQVCPFPGICWSKLVGISLGNSGPNLIDAKPISVEPSFAEFGPGSAESGPIVAGVELEVDLVTFPGGFGLEPGWVHRSPVGQNCTLLAPSPESPLRSTPIKRLLTRKARERAAPIAGASSSHSSTNSSPIRGLTVLRAGVPTEVLGAQMRARGERRDGSEAKMRGDRKPEMLRNLSRISLLRRALAVAPTRARDPAGGPVELHRGHEQRDAGVADPPRVANTCQPRSTAVGGTRKMIKYCESRRR